MSAANSAHRLPRADARERRAAPLRPVRVECLERARCEGFVRARGPLRRVLAALAGRMVAARGWDRLGFARSGDYARERLGLSARSLQDLARVDALIAPLPLLEAALVSGALTWTKVRLVARVAKPGDEARWIAFARRMTARQLAREVRAIDLGAVRRADGGEEADEDGATLEPRGGLRTACTRTVQRRWHFVRQLARRVAGEPVPPWQVLENVAAEVLSAVPLEVLPEEHSLASTARPRTAAASGCAAQGLGEERWSAEEAGALEARPPSRQTGAHPRHPREDGELFWVGPADAIALVRATIRTVRRRFGLASDGEALGAMFEHAVSVWRGEARVKKAWRVFERDGWRCTAPGCSSYRELQDHHIVFRSAGGSDEEENRTTLCAFHHLRGVHGARPSLRMTGRAPGRLRFELGLRPGRAPLATYAGETLSA